MAQLHPTVEELAGWGFSELTDVGMDTESYKKFTPYGYVKCNLKSNAVGHEWQLHQVGASLAPNELESRDNAKTSNLNLDIETEEELLTLLKVLKIPA